MFSVHALTLAEESQTLFVQFVNDVQLPHIVESPSCVDVVSSEHDRLDLERLGIEGPCAVGFAHGCKDSTDVVLGVGNTEEIVLLRPDPQTLFVAP